MSADEVYARAKMEIDEARTLTQHLIDEGFIAEPSPDMLEAALEKAVAQVQ